MKSFLNFGIVGQFWDKIIYIENKLDASLDKRQNGKNLAKKCLLPNFYDNIR